ncbi:excisionase [Methylobacterium frigidaeris]|uniref:excisionase n=1 Tax=Methylobacterium frigidaeris TaxID=2038277 RepID=UPI001EDD572F|nr:excisionase [Methylobacterium frigidaeris]
MTKPPTKEPLARSQISDDAPLRLADAARLAFPAGGMTAASLRREAAKGRLSIERIAGKDFTTLAAIERMRELCRLPPKEISHNPASGGPAPPDGYLRPHAAASGSIAKEAAHLLLQKIITSPQPAPTRPAARRAKPRPTT